MGKNHGFRSVGMATSLALTLMAALLFLATSASAAPTTLNWGTEVNAGECETKGSPVVNVTHKVINSIDSGFNGYWAYVDYNKQIRLWDQGNDTYCAVVSYLGHFTGEEGQDSPGMGSTDTLDGDETGTFQGGYRATITGELRAEPAWATRGNLGVMDHDCEISTANCPGSENWIDQYFESGYEFAYEWWGWIYNGGQYGTWVNSSAGSEGDIS